MKTFSKENVQEIVNIKKSYAHTWKAVTKQVNDQENVTLEDGSVLTPQQAWSVLNVAASVKGVAKATDIKKAWSLVSAGNLDVRDYRVRKQVSMKVRLGKKYFTLHTKEVNEKGDVKYSAVKYWKFFNMKNEGADGFNKKTDVVISADFVLQGLYDCKYKEDTLKEVAASQEAADALEEGCIDNSEKNEKANWVHVVRTGENTWAISEGTEEGVTVDAPQQAPIDLNVKTA